MNIYVGNLAREITEQELQSEFAQFGEVSSCRIIKDRFSGESRGFGFVEMPSQEQAEKAINSLSGKELKGKQITVNQARPRQPRSDNRDFRHNSRRPRRSW
jgi:RNA recognition motif-containing protein